jgi:hypothetical protein
MGKVLGESTLSYREVHNWSTVFTLEKIDQKGRMVHYFDSESTQTTERRHHLLENFIQFLLHLAQSNLGFSKDFNFVISVYYCFR